MDTNFFVIFSWQFRLQIQIQVNIKVRDTFTYKTLPSDQLVYLRELLSLSENH